MRAPLSLRDVTETVPIGDAAAVADAVAALMSRRFGDAWDSDLLRRAFADAGRLFAGDYPGYLACDMPYHDLRHSLDTALVMARLIDGWQAAHAGDADALSAELALLGILLALLHDTGLIRRVDEGERPGPSYMHCHEDRSIDFAESYLRGTSLERHAPLALLIDSTRMVADLELLFAGRPAPLVALGHMLGSAAVLSQIADRSYIERCFYHLYPEFVVAGVARVRRDDGKEEIVYADAYDLLRKTPAFCEQLVSKRLREDFRDVRRCLGHHFAGDDPYAHAISGNLRRLEHVLDDGGFKLLRRAPLTTTRHLAPIYLAHAATVGHGS